MPKRADLSTSLDSLREVAGSRTAPPRPAPLRRRSTAAAATSPAARAETVPLTVHVPGAVRAELKHLAVDRGSTLAAIVGEGLNLVLSSYGRPEIAPATPGKPGRPWGSKTKHR